jgi:hypothetical protein
MSKNQFSLQLTSVTTGYTAVYYCARHRMMALQCKLQNLPWRVAQDQQGVLSSKLVQLQPQWQVQTHMTFFLKIQYLPSQLPPNTTMYSDSGYLSCIRISEMFLFYFSFVLEAVVFELESCASYVIALTQAAKPPDQFGFR